MLTACGSATKVLRGWRPYQGMDSRCRDVDQTRGHSRPRRPPHNPHYAFEDSVNLRSNGLLQAHAGLARAVMSPPSNLHRNTGASKYRTILVLYCTLAEAPAIAGATGPDSMSWTLGHIVHSMRALKGLQQRDGLIRPCLLAPVPRVMRLGSRLTWCPFQSESTTSSSQGKCYRVRGSQLGTAFTWRLPIIRQFH